MSRLSPSCSRIFQQCDHRPRRGGAISRVINPWAALGVHMATPKPAPVALTDAEQAGRKSHRCAHHGIAKLAANLGKWLNGPKP